MTTKDRSNKYGLLGLLLLAVFALVISFVSYPKANVLTATQQFEQTATAIAQNDPTNIMIQGLEEQLADPNLPEEARQDLTARLNSFDNLATEHARAAIHATYVATRYTPIPRATRTPGPTKVYEKMIGIFPNPAVPLPSSSYHINNAWADYIDGKYYTVFAGSDKKDPSHSIVAVMDGETYQIRIFETPEQATSVTLIDARGHLLTLQTDDGRLFYFDVLKMRFVDPPNVE